MATADTKAFAFSAKATGKNVVLGHFEIDGQKFDIRKRKDAQLAYLIAEVGDDADPDKAIKAVLNFTEQALVPEAARRFYKLALGHDGGDGLELTEIMQVFQYILSVITADPTGGAASASSRSRKTTTAASRAATS